MFLKAEFRLPCKTAAVAAAALACSSLFAEGFRNPPPGSFSLARAGGRYAQVDNAEAAYHNPANMVDLPASIEASPTFVYLKVDYDGPAGTAETKDPFKILPHAFFTTPIIENKLAAGFALTTPFGLANEWKREGSFGPAGAWRYTPYYTEMVTINANPSVAYKINDRVSLGAGLDILWSQLTLRQFYPAIFGNPETMVRAKGDGVGVGGNAAITFNITEKQKFAVSYRSPFDIEYEGGTRFDNPPPGALKESDFGTEVKFPTILGAGYGIEVNDKFRVEIDGEWVQFSRFKELVIDAGSNNPYFPAPTRTIPENWRDTFTAGIAGDYKLTEDWTIRAGYQFYETPVPDSTFSPTIPDANQHAFTTGLSYRHGNHTGEFSYGYIKYDERDIPAPNPFAGHYEMNVHLFSLAYIYQF